MATLKAILGTIVAVALIIGFCAIGGAIWIAVCILFFVAVAIAVITAIYITIREELQPSEKELPPDT